MNSCSGKLNSGLGWLRSRLASFQVSLWFFCWMKIDVLFVSLPVLLLFLEESLPVFDPMDDLHHWFTRWMADHLLPRATPREPLEGSRSRVPVSIPSTTSQRHLPRGSTPMSWSPKLLSGAHYSNRLYNPWT